jgi:hypothetical protein
MLTSSAKSVPGSRALWAAFPACALWMALLACVAWASAAQAAPPPRIKVYYDLSYNGTVMAHGSETLEHDGRSYRIESEVKGKGLFALMKRGEVKRYSRGEVALNVLRPVEFRDQRGDRAPEFARFDWGRRIVTHERDSKIDSTPITDGMQDRVSFLWSLSFAPPKAEVAAQVADGRGTTRFRYGVAGREILKTAAGDIEALHLVKIRDAGDARETEVWLAVQRGFVPVRLLVVEKDGARVDQVVTRIEP